MLEGGDLLLGKNGCAFRPNGGKKSNTSSGARQTMEPTAGG